MLTLIRFLIFVGPSGCRPYNVFSPFPPLPSSSFGHIRQRQDRTVSRSRVYNRFLLLLQWTPRLSSLKHPYFHDSSIAMNISYMVGHGGQHRGSSKDDKDSIRTASSHLCPIRPLHPLCLLRALRPLHPFHPLQKIEDAGEFSVPRISWDSNSGSDMPNALGLVVCCHCDLRINFKNIM